MSAPTLLDRQGGFGLVVQHLGGGRGDVCEVCEG